MPDKYNLNDEARTICQAAASAIILGKKWTSTRQGGYFNDEMLANEHGDEPMKFTTEEHVEIMRLSQEISRNFDWDASPQGYEFWWQIHEALKKCVEPE